MKISLGKLKAPIIAGYIAGWFMTLLVAILVGGTLASSTTSEVIYTVFLAFIWPITTLIELDVGVFGTVYASAIVVGVLTWFALRGVKK